MSDQSDAVADAAERRRNEPLFGKLTRRPDQAMLANQQRKFSTFVDQCDEHVANIADAFGGRGRLLVHACIAEAPGSRSKPKEESKEAKVQLVQVVKGEAGSMGDKRRMDGEIRLRKFAPCGASCLGRGLCLPVDTAPCFHNHQMAVALASLDMDALTKCAQDAGLDLGTFFPPVTIKTEAEVDKAETAKIDQTFLLPAERLTLLDLERRCLAKKDSMEIDQIHPFERRLMPVLHLPSLAEKVKLYHVCTLAPNLQKAADDAFETVERGCNDVRTSEALLDLLAVTMQIASYVKNFGETDLGQGFQLMKLQYYEGFMVGKQSFLTVLCTFIRNLRPREHDDSRSCSTTDLKEGAKPVKTPRQRKGRTFMDRLEAEMQHAREVHKWGLSPKQLEAQISQVMEFSEFVESRLTGEVQLFSSARTPDMPPPTADEHFAELAAWAGGRQRLQAVAESLRSTQDHFKTRMNELAACERRLQEFAAVREDDFGRDGYIEILGVLFNFLDNVKKVWTNLDAAPQELQQLHNSLLAAAPLQILFASDCLEASFALWKNKAESMECASPAWDETMKQDALRSLYGLFDTNADAKVDAEELRITLKAFGLEMAEDSHAHLEVVRSFDDDGDGTMDLNEFGRFVDARMQNAFHLFKDTPGASGVHGEISEQDLLRVAKKLGQDLSAEESKKMINILDDSSAGNGMVDFREFEQLILMKPDAKKGRISNYHALNEAKSKSDSAKKFQLVHVPSDDDAENEG